MFAGLKVVGWIDHNLAFQGFEGKPSFCIRAVLQTPLLWL